jgi:hypothetical protein
MIVNDRELRPPLLSGAIAPVQSLDQAANVLPFFLKMCWHLHIAVENQLEMLIVERKFQHRTTHLKRDIW